MDKFKKLIRVSDSLSHKRVKDSSDQYGELSDVAQYLTEQGCDVSGNEYYLSIPEAQYNEDLDLYIQENFDMSPAELFNDPKTNQAHYEWSIVEDDDEEIEDSRKSRGARKSRRKVQDSLQVYVDKATGGESSQVFVGTWDEISSETGLTEDTAASIWYGDGDFDISGELLYETEFGGDSYLYPLAEAKSILKNYKKDTVAPTVAAIGGKDDLAQVVSELEGVFRAHGITDIPWKEWPWGVEVQFKGRESDPKLVRDLRRVKSDKFRVKVEPDDYGYGPQLSVIVYTKNK